MNKLPVYEAQINSELNGIVAISLVDLPAVESNWMSFKEETVKPLYRFEDEEKHNVLGCIMRADFPIFRRDKNNYEYYITYSKQTIEKMAQKMVSDETYKNISLMHNGELINGVHLEQLFIKDSAKGISPEGFEDIQDGSLFAIYHITDEELWKAIKQGIFKGFSLEGYFDTKLVQNSKQNMSKNLIEKFKETVKNFLQEYSKVETKENVVIVYEGDELVEGLEVLDENGNPISDGEYHVEGKVIVVADSKVVEIKEEEVVEEPKEEVVVEEMEKNGETEAVTKLETETVEETTTVEEVKENNAEVEALKAEVEDLKKQIEEIKEVLNKPVVPPVVEQFSKIEENKPKSWVK